MNRSSAQLPIQTTTDNENIISTEKTYISTGSMVQERQTYNSQSSLPLDTRPIGANGSTQTVPIIAQPPIPSSDLQPISMKSTGLVYDVRMLGHMCIEEEHPENPDRIKGIYEALKAAGYLNRCVRIPAREAKDEELLMYHTPEHNKTIRSTAGKKYHAFS